jgi:hypothetical protein
MKFVFPDNKNVVIHETPKQEPYQQTKLQLVKPTPHAPLLTTSLVAQGFWVYEHAAAAVFHATQFNVAEHITHATSLLRVAKNTEFANAVAIGAPLKRQLPPQVRQENAVASPNQYAGRPGVPTAC